MDTVKQTIGNREKNSGFVLACIVCGGTKNITLNAHRNPQEQITGFIGVCNSCTAPEFLHLSDKKE